MADNAEVVVRKTAATVNGTYYAVINPTLRDKAQVTVTFPASKVTDLLTQTTHAVNAPRMDLTPARCVPSSCPERRFKAKGPAQPAGPLSSRAAVRHQARSFW